MINWLISMGISASLGKSIIDLVNAGLAISTIVSLFTTAGIGASLLMSLKGILKKKGFEAALR